MPRNRSTAFPLHPHEFLEALQDVAAGSGESTDRCWNAHLSVMQIEDRVGKYVEKQIGWSEVSVKKEMCE